MAEDTKVVLKEIEVKSASGSADEPEYEVIHSKSPAFYDIYERKTDLKHQTHYCPGCGHGVVHKLIAEAIEDLGLLDRTIVVSPVACSVFAYYYFDVGNVQVAHGRAPAAATGIKRACPDKIVLSYQGDGDMAAIGTAEIIHAANRGEKITCFFVNNAIYGMTGGQMAPTTLVGQKSTTSPWGRRPANEGFPVHMSEMLATLQAPAYIERVALSDNKNIVRARRAIRKAIENQKNGVGFSFVEILSPCPTIWGKDPVVARKWVAEAMIPAFPLNVFRDQTPVLPEVTDPPLRAIPDVLEVNSSAVQCHNPHPHHFREMTIKVAGFGGQGVLLLGQLLTEMGMREGLEVSWLPSYGPEMRSGSAHCHVCLSRERIGSPLVSRPDILIAMNEISLRKFAPQVVAGGTIFYNRESLPPDFVSTQARVICVPASEMADRLGSGKVANVIILGALLEETECMAPATAMGVIETKVKKVELLETNRKALQEGQDFIANEVNIGAVTQPDGFAY